MILLIEIIQEYIFRYSAKFNNLNLIKIYFKLFSEWSDYTDLMKYSFLSIKKLLIFHLFNIITDIFIKHFLNIFVLNLFLQIFIK